MVSSERYVPLLRLQALAFLGHIFPDCFGDFLYSYVGLGLGVGGCTIPMRTSYSRTVDPPDGLTSLRVSWNDLQ
jgi:hypothetical protein